MTNSCSSCLYKWKCDSDSMCSDYTSATKKEIDELFKNTKEMEQSSTNIHDYDEQDAYMRNLLDRSKYKDIL